MSTYRAFEATGVRNVQLVERELVDPAPGQVRLRVEACGVCHTDVLAVEGLRADPSLPIVPGHEIVGVIDAVGAGVTAWHLGDRVGVGFLNGHCGECEPCRRGNFVNCFNQAQTGTSTDGGYAEVAYARASGLVRIPQGLSAIDAAPLLCAGLTTFVALQRGGNQGRLTRRSTGHRRPGASCAAVRTQPRVPRGRCGTRYREGALRTTVGRTRVHRQQHHRSR
ncbi:alcohol dehydrogenase catalytic domain-containing protein [Streptomyces sp. NPDC051362]|uniref:alcohol dehydrogenase catalytic domain-containing protein n=1 Tax=Streptomyces sp. NPDC051362 TaxID=3365651 RepID=UPI0037AB3EEC